MFYPHSREHNQIELELEFSMKTARNLLEVWR